MIAVVSVAVCAVAYGATCHGSLIVAVNVGWWITQGLGLKLNVMRFDEYVDTLVDLYVGRHSLNGKQS